MLVKVHRIHYKDNVRIETPILLNIDLVETIEPIVSSNAMFEGYSIVTFPSINEVSREIYIAESVDHIAAHLPSIVRV